MLKLGRQDSLLVSFDDAIREVFDWLFHSEQGLTKSNRQEGKMEYTPSEVLQCNALLGARAQDDYLRRLPALPSPPPPIFGIYIPPSLKRVR